MKKEIYISLACFVCVLAISCCFDSKKPPKDHLPDSMEMPETTSSESNNMSELLIDEEDEKTDDIKQYDSAIVHISMDTHGGSGVIVDINENEKQCIYTVVSNKHLLDEAASGTVTICNAEYEGNVTYLSEQYDMGIMQVCVEDETKVLGKQVKPLHFAETEQSWKELTYLGTNVYQYSSMEKNRIEHHNGYIIGYEFRPEFNNEMLVTKCYASKGMSGGAVLHENGTFLALISGGANEGESDITYSLSSEIIKQEIEEYRQRKDR